MFSTSTHKKYWLFISRRELNEQRRRANENFIRDNCPDEEGNADVFLSSAEEHQLCQLVEETAQKFCQSFEPAFLPTVVYTGFVYFKRFYLHNSVMEYLAKNVMMSCLYLACKVDEFNVSIDEFVRNLKSGTPQSNASIILSLEAQILRHLQFQLLVHCPYRPLEGHFIEIKTTCPNIPKVENLRAGCQDFLWRSLLTDVCLLYTPTQIALAAILHVGEQMEYDIHQEYIVAVLCNGDVNKADTLVAKLRDCINLVTSVETTSKETASHLQSRAQQYMALLDQINERRSKRKLDQGENAEDSKRMRSVDGEEGSDSDD